jgi:hypothetical protein
MRLVRRHFERGNQVAADPPIGFDHLREAIGRAVHQLIGQQHREGLVADDGTGAPDRVAEPERVKEAIAAARVAIANRGEA